jgi:Rieske-like [2Fe-2S] domain
MSSISATVEIASSGALEGPCHPDAPRKIGEFSVWARVERRDLRIKRHAADWASSQTFVSNLGMRRAYPNYSGRGGWFGQQRVAKIGFRSCDKFASSACAAKMITVAIMICVMPGLRRVTSQRKSTARLSNGRIRRGAIMCPLHGARFNLADGRCIGAAYPSVRQFDLRVVDGSAEVLVPTAPPGMQETPVPF